MNILKPLWFLQEPQDTEKMQYLFMAYIEMVEREFLRLRIDPHLTNIVNISTSGKTFLEKRIESPKSYRKFIEKYNVPESDDLVDLYDIEKALKIHADENNNGEAKPIIDLIEWSIPLLDSILETGQNIWESISECIEIHYLGGFPKNKDIGYVLFHADGSEDIIIYRYTITTTSKNVPGTHKGCYLEYVDTRHVRYNENGDIDFLSIRNENMNIHPDDCLYLTAYSRIEIPIQETLYPILRNMIHEEILRDFFRRY